jgi:hypothetical protein
MGITGITTQMKSIPLMLEFSVQNNEVKNGMIGTYTI